MTTAASRKTLPLLAAALLLFGGAAHASSLELAQPATPGASVPTSAPAATRPASNLRITPTSIIVAGYEAPKAAHKQR